MKITVETNVAAPIEQVWDAYTTPADIKQWNAASADWHTTTATVDLREGASFLRAWRRRTAAWASILPEPIPDRQEHLIESSFGDRAARVEFTQTPQGVAVCVTFDSEQTHPIEQQRQGWQSILDNFARHVEAKSPPTSASQRATVQPYLFFRGRCEEAIEYYKAKLDAEVLMQMRFKDNPDKPGPDKVSPASISASCTLACGSRVPSSSCRMACAPADGLRLRVPLSQPADRSGGRSHLQRACSGRQGHNADWQDILRATLRRRYRQGWRPMDGDRATDDRLMRVAQGRYLAASRA